MAKTIKVRIPVIVTADGKWATSHGHSHGDPDWSWIDEMCDGDAPTICPQRLWVIAELPLPSEAEVMASVELEK